MSPQTPDAQSSRPLSQHQHAIPVTHSIPPTTPAHPPLPATPQVLSAPRTPPSAPETGLSNAAPGERATSFADHSWDLGAGGLKTLTAKRELPPGIERRATGNQQLDTTAASRSYMFTLVILACIVVMLISGGIVLFMMLQP